ncbi:MAG: excinuclease ABC subunit C [Bacteroidales bacterium]|nr:excinuclease ABC subunit C [Bacteroidales bacterium]
MFSDVIKQKINSLPQKPGVYQYLDAEGNIIYIGKARNLKKRVSSYFNKEHTNAKLKLLIKKISQIEIILVKSEFDALLLENNLIKQYQPRFNVLLKDDKTYPWICVTNELFPKIFLSRSRNLKNTDYFGPYPSVRMARSIVDAIRKIFTLRTCNLNITEDGILKKKFKPCLEKQIGNCLAPCIGEQSVEEYADMVLQVRNILKGNINPIISVLKQKMNESVEVLNFENAQKIKLKLEALNMFQSRSGVTFMKFGDIDVFSIVSDNEFAYVNFLRLQNGNIVQGHTFSFRKKMEETDSELLMIGLGEFLSLNGNFAPIVLLPFELDIEIQNVKFEVPKISDKKQLLDLSLANAAQFRQEHLERRKLVDPERYAKYVMQSVMKDLHLKKTPEYIECYDNSNFQGTDAVSSCVVFRNAKPSKKEYRIFNIKSVEGPDDFASMKEVISRRMSRLINENKELPDLLIVDGGKGQLSSAVEALDETGIKNKVPVIGIAKRLEEVYFPGDTMPIYLDKRSETLKLIQRMRDEAHRFGISHHRNKRSKGLLKTELTEIEGVGTQTATKLLRHFGSVASLKKASKEELEKIVGKKVLNAIIEWQGK